MNARRYDDFEAEVDESIAYPPNDNKSSMSTKLERRRRIEELNEERRLRDELGEFSNIG